MRLGNYSRFLCSLALLLLIVGTPNLASAADFYWQHSASASYMGGSKTEACIAYSAANSSKYRYKRYSDTSSTSSDCYYEQCWTTSYGIANCPPFNGQSNYYVEVRVGYVTRKGTSCPSGTEYNSVTGTCDLPPGPVACEQTWTGGEMVYSESQKQCVKYPNLSPEEYCSWSAGKSTGFSKISAVSGDASGPSYVADPGTFCGIKVEKSECKMNTAGTYDCVVSGTFTGEYDPTATKAPGHCDTQDCETVPPEDPAPEPEVVKIDTPCVYSASGDKQVCSTTKSEEQEGTAQCGYVNGVQTCITKQPSKNGIDITTEVTKQTMADGSTVTTKKDTATVTKCTGVKNCSTSTATTTTTTKKDANGNTTSTGSTCTGTACGSSSNPDADGDGVGDCKPGEECGTGSGEGQDWYTPGDDTFASVLTQFSTAVKQTPIASQTTKFLTFTASGSCPRWSVSVWVFDIDIDQLCSGDIPWAAIKAVILAAAAFLSFRIALF